MSLAITILAKPLEVHVLISLQLYKTKLTLIYKLQYNYHESAWKCVTRFVFVFD